MIVYLVAASLSAMIAHLAKIMRGTDSREEGYSNDSIIMMLIAALPLILVSAIRYNVGSDYFSYCRLFAQRFDDKREVGYVLFNRFLHLFSDDPQIFFVVTSLFIGAAFFYRIARESDVPEFSILLYMISTNYFVSNNLVRQYVAISICLFGFSFYQRKQTIPFLFFVVLAFTYHQTAVAMILLYAFHLVRVPPLFRLGIFGAMFGGGLFLRPVVMRILTRYTRFGQYFSENSEYGSGRINYTYLTIYFAIFCMLLFYYELLKDERDYDLLFNAVTAGIIMILSGGFLNAAVYRLVYYADFFIVLYLPNFLRNVRQKAEDYRITFLMAVVIVAAYLFFSLPPLLRGREAAIPYHVIFFKELSIY